MKILKKFWPEILLLPVLGYIAYIAIYFSAEAGGSIFQYSLIDTNDTVLGHLFSAGAANHPVWYHGAGHTFVHLAWGPVAIYGVTRLAVTLRRKLSTGTTPKTSDSYKKPSGS